MFKRLLPAIVAALAAAPSMSAFAQTNDGPQPAQPRHTEVRGTWLTTTANENIATPAKTAESMKKLREMGFNTVYVETWKNGYTQFPSPTLKATIGVERRPNLVEGFDEPRDLLEETMIQAHRNGLLYVAWFEYGFMAAHKGTENELRTQKREWLSEDINGNIVAPNGFVWMNPLRPETRAFLTRIVLDAVDKYDLDGVQLDDRLVWPYYTMGYDAYTREVYAREHDGRQPPEDPKDPQWIRWRADKVNEFAKQFADDVRKARPELIVTVSPSPFPWSYENYCCDWPVWVAGGWYDEYIPQMYRNNYPRFEQEWLANIEWMGEKKDQLVAGLRVVGEGDPTPWADLQKMIELTRTTESGGYVLWFSRGVLEVYPQEIAAFHDVATQGHAAHPLRPTNWRLPPVVARHTSGDAWEVSVETPGKYRTIYRKGDVWKEAGTATYEAGKHTLSVKGADAVELLIDRRGADPRQVAAQAN